MPSIEINTYYDTYWEYIPISVNAESCIGISDLTFYINNMLVSATSSIYGVCNLFNLDLCGDIISYFQPNINPPTYYLSLPSSHFTDSSYAINVTAKDLNGNIAESNTVEVMNCRFQELPTASFIVETQCEAQCVSNCWDLCSHCDTSCGCLDIKSISWGCYIESETIAEFATCFDYGMNNIACPAVICCECRNSSPYCYDACMEGAAP